MQPCMVTDCCPGEYTYTHTHTHSHKHTYTHTHTDIESLTDSPTQTHTVLMCVCVVIQRRVCGHSGERGKPVLLRVTGRAPDCDTGPAKLRKGHAAPNVKGPMWKEDLVQWKSHVRVRNQILLSLVFYFLFIYSSLLHHLHDIYILII